MCLYELGVLDNGYPEGLTDGEMAETLGTVRDMARELGAEVRVVKTAKGKRGTVAEVEVREGSRSSVVDVRVAVIGNEQSGKSTLVGVLCSGRMDNGRGSARMNVFRHRHEVESGHTSSLSSQLLGFDEAGRVINMAGSSPSPSSFSSHSWSGITDRASKVITFSDLVGHESGAKVTTSALLADAVDYALIVVSAQEGLTAMDREYSGHVRRVWYSHGGGDEQSGPGGRGEGGGCDCGDRGAAGWVGCCGRCGEGAASGGDGGGYCRCGAVGCCGAAVHSLVCHWSAHRPLLLLPLHTSTTTQLDSRGTPAHHASPSTPSTLSTTHPSLAASS